LDDTITAPEPRPNQMSRRGADLIEAAYARYASGLKSFIRSLVPIYEDAEDILQDVFYQLTSSLDQIQSLERLGSWLYTVARNKMVDLSRKKRPINETDLQLRTPDEDPILLEDILPDLSGNPEREWLSQWVLSEIEAAIDGLPEDQRWVFQQHEIEGVSFREMSEITGVSVNTLLARKRYAILHLRKRLQSLTQDENMKG